MFYESFSAEPVMTPAICVYPGTACPLRFRDCEREALAPGWVRIAGGARSVCGTDRSVVDGSHFIPHPARPERFLILGHEAGGVITEMPEQAAGISLGTKCCVKVRYPDLKAPDFWHSIDRVDLSLRQNCSVAGMFKMDGFLRPEFTVPFSGVVPLPDDFPLELASLPDLVSCVRKGVRHAFGCRAVVLGELDISSCRAIVLGCGPAGLTAIKMFVEAGVNEVIAVDICDASAAKARLALSAGPQVSYLRSQWQSLPSLRRAAREIGTADFLFEASGQRDIGEAWVSALGPAGVVVWFGIPHGRQQIEPDVSEHAQFKLSRSILETNVINATTPDWHWAVKHIGRHKDYYRQLLFPILGWDEGLLLYDALRDPSSLKPRIMLPDEAPCGTG